MGEAIAGLAMCVCMPMGIVAIGYVLFRFGTRNDVPKEPTDKPQEGGP